MSAEGEQRFFKHPCLKVRRFQFSAAGWDSYSSAVASLAASTSSSTAVGMFKRPPVKIVCQVVNQGIEIRAVVGDANGQPDEGRRVSTSID